MDNKDLNRKQKQLLPIGLIISLVSVFVFLLAKNLLSQSQIINLFDSRGFNNVAIALISMLISISFGLIWIYIIVKHRKRKNEDVKI
jgi:uncharacterized BrkB/YihY/UPF0761 family membrane protein